MILQNPFRKFMPIVALLGALLLAGCSKKRAVIVYTSQDQIYAEPLLAEFTKETGIQVLPVFDSESVKTAGLAQRLIAEKGNPRADIFWSNEEMLSRRLVDLGALESESWARGGFRTRRIIVNTNLLPLAKAPKSLDELTNAAWAGHVAMAYPIYGTTAAHLVALRQAWGDERWKRWCEAFVANKPFIVDGNSVVVKLVGSGEAWIGLTDSDDFAAGQRNQLPIDSVTPCADSMPIPNSVGIVRGAPHRAEAEAFSKFALSEKTLTALTREHALEGLKFSPGALQLKWPAPVEETQEMLKTIFARR